MKKSVGLLVILLCLSTLGFSQFTKGKFLAGGSFSANVTSNNNKSGSTTTNSGNSSSLNVYPQVGYFFMDNFAAGAGVSLNTGSSKSNNVKYTYTGVYFSPFARYYFDKIYGQVAFDVGTTKTKNDAPSSTVNKNNTKGWTLAAGYAYLLNDHVAIEPQIGYGVNYQDGNLGKYNTGNFFIKVGFQIYLGK